MSSNKDKLYLVLPMKRIQKIWKGKWKKKESGKGNEKKKESGKESGKKESGKGSEKKREWKGKKKEKESKRKNNLIFAEIVKK